MDSKVVRYVDGLYMIRFHEYVTPAEKKDFFAQHRLELYRDESSTGRWHVRGIPSSDNRARIANFLTESVIAKASLIRITKVIQSGNESRPSGIESSGGSSPKNSYSSLLYDEDQYYEWQWYLNNTGVIEGDSTGATPDADINAPEAWAIEEGEPLFVAVLDTGIPLNGQGNLDHEDLKNVGTTRVIELFGWANFIDDPDLDDLNGHGTKVTGVLTATKDNGDGIAGLVTENIRMVPVKVLDMYGYAAILDVASAIDYTIYKLEIENPSYEIILNLSFGWDGEEEWEEDIEELEYSVINAKNHDVLMVCAIGNVQSDSVGYPAAFSTSHSNVIAVGSTNWNDVVSSKSATGSQITVVAPGGGDGVFKPRMGGYKNIYTTEKYGDYEHDSGTSLATPQVAGLAALVWSYRPDWDSEDVRQAIIDNAVDIGAPFNRAGNGRIDAYATVSNLVDDVTEPSGLRGTYYPRFEIVELEWNRNSEYQEVDYYQLDCAEEDGEFYVLGRRIWDPGSGDVVEYTHRELEPGVEYYRYRVRAHNDEGWGPFSSYPATVWIEDWRLMRGGAESAPEDLTLEPNYPNPFNPSTQIKFGLPAATHVRLQIMNIRGQIVRVLVDEEKLAGWYTVTWDGKNESGRDVASGIYLYLIEADNKKILKRMTIIR